jgi:hypothetical protein
LARERPAVALLVPDDLSDTSYLIAEAVVPLRTVCVVLLALICSVASACSSAGVHHITSGDASWAPPNPQDAGPSTGACGRFTDAGARICCGAATELPGLSCVDLSRPGGEYGTYGHCIAEGDSFEAKIAGARCCVGLKGVGSERETDEVFSGYRPGCGPGAQSVSTVTCVACGNGKCDSLENRCNCPADCGARTGDGGPAS